MSHRATAIGVFGALAVPATALAIDLEVPPLFDGESVTIEVTNATANGTVSLWRSTMGPGQGPCPPVLGGDCMGILSPIRVGLPLSADAAGAVSFSLSLPVGVSGNDLSFQAVDHGSLDLSTVSTQTIVLPPVDEACAAAFTYADPNATDVFLPINPLTGTFDERTLGMRPVTVTGDYEVTFSGPMDVWRADGSSVLSGDNVADADLLVESIASGTGAITFTPVGAGDTCDYATSHAPAPGLVGRPLADHPWFESVNVFATYHQVELAFDPSVWTDRAGQPFDVVVVPHRTAAEWAADNTLLDAVSGPHFGTVATELADPAVVAWDLPEAGVDLLTPYDVVIDFGQDGTLDAGDLVENFAEPDFFVSIDPDEEGPYTSERITFLSAAAFRDQRIYAPAERDELDPLPLVVISHGNGHDYTWYDYLGEHLASWGFIVMSHQNNTVPGTVTAAETTWENTDHFLANLSGIDGGSLDGHVDDSRISWIGHSRGGEGVVIAYNWLVTGARVPLHYTADDIVSVHSIAPVVFEDPLVDTNPNAVPYHLIAGSRDGDVTGGVSFGGGVQYYRILQHATGPTYVTYLRGADHNDFNCCGFNDSVFTSGSGPIIGRTEAQRVAKGKFLTLLMAEVDGQTELLEYFAREPSTFLSPGGFGERTTQYRTSAAADKFVIDDFQSEFSDAVSSSGGAVTITTPRFLEDEMDDSNTVFTHSAVDLMNGMTQANSDTDAARGVVVGWEAADDGASIAFEMTGDGINWSSWHTLSFRACQTTRHPSTVAQAGPIGWTIEIEDGSGQTASLLHDVFATIPKTYERTGDGVGSGWSNEFQTVRVPVNAFSAGGVDIDMTDIVSLRFVFGSSFGVEQGQIGLDDIELLSQGAL